MFSKPAITLNGYSNTLTAILRAWMDNMSQPKISVGAKSTLPYPDRTEMDYITDNPMFIRVHRVANGFVVQTAVREGERALAHIATTIEEVHEIITTQLVTKKMEGR